MGFKRRLVVQEEKLLELADRIDGMLSTEEMREAALLFAKVGHMELPGKEAEITTAVILAQELMEHMNVGGSPLWLEEILRPTQNTVRRLIQGWLAFSLAVYGV